MSPRVTAVLAVLVVLVGAYIFAVDRPQAQRAEEAKHLVRISKEAVTGITLESPKGTVEIARRGPSSWEITSPFRAPAASFGVSDLLDAVAGVVPQRSLGNPGHDLAAYGLDKPVARVTLRTARGRAVTLEVGKTSPVTTAVYARVEPGGAVYLVDTSIKDSLTKSATDLRQKTVADFANSDVQRVRIRGPRGQLAIDRAGPDRWTLEGPRPWPADDFKVTDLFFPLTTTDAKKFHDGVDDPAAYGLDHPAVTVELWLKGRSDPLRILLARRGKVTYAMVAGSHTVLEMDGSLQDKLTPQPIDLVSHRLLPYNVQNLTGLVWRRAGKSLEVRRQGPGFTGGGLTDQQISDMFSAINVLDADKVEALTTPPPGAPAFEIQTHGGKDAQFLVDVYRVTGDGWIAVDRALGLEYRFSASAFDGFPAPVKAFLGLGAAKKGAPGKGAPKGSPGQRPATAR